MPDEERERPIRPLILGAGGLVGRQLAAHLEGLFPDTVAATRVEIDVTDRWRLEAEVERLEPTVIVNATAMSGVDACERDPELAHLINAEGPAYLAAVCRNAGLRLVHLSTDYVFDGEKGGEYVESDPPSPVNEYGLSKLRGEMAILENLAEAVVLRVSFVFGPGRSTYFDSLVRKAIASTDEVEVVEGWVSRPTYTGEIVRGVAGVLRSDATGVWHLACPAAVGRAEFARTLFRLLGRDPERIVSIPSDSLELPAKRPASTSLDTSAFEARFGPIRPWTECAEEYLRHATLEGRTES